MFFDRLKDYQIHKFYNGDGEKKFTNCPFVRGGNDAYWHPDNLRRGQGGGVQVWQYINAVRLTKNPYIIRMRNDLWFTKSSIDVIMSELNKILNGENDVTYLGSNWLDGEMGAEYEVRKKFKVVEDFMIIAKRDKLLSYDDTIKELNLLRPNDLRSGNKCFKIITKDRKRKVLCRMFLTRQTYKDYPTDKQVCYDYLLSYCNSRDGVDKMKPALDWLESFEPWKDVQYNKLEEIVIGNGYRIRLHR